MTALEAKRRVDEAVPKMFEKEKKNILEAIEAAVGSLKYHVQIITFNEVSSKIHKHFTDLGYSVTRALRDQGHSSYVTYNISWQNAKHEITDPTQGSTGTLVG